MNTWKQWLASMASLVKSLATARDQGKFGYDPTLAAELRRELGSQPPHEVVAGHCGSNPDTHDWARRVYLAGRLTEPQVAVLRTLEPGPHGGVFVLGD